MLDFKGVRLLHDTVTAKGIRYRVIETAIGDTTDVSTKVVFSFTAVLRYAIADKTYHKDGYYLVTVCY